MGKIEQREFLGNISGKGLAFDLWCMGEKEDGRDDGGTALATKRKAKTKKPRLYKVILHNDDYTTMDFVIGVLQRFFHKNHAEATHLMLTVHHQGQAVVGLYSRDVAETKVTQVESFAREHGHPLRCSMEPE